MWACARTTAYDTITLVRRWPSLVVLLAVAVFSTVCTAASQARSYEMSGSASGRTSFTAIPGRALQGQQVVIVVKTRPGVACQLGVRYADGTRQVGIPRVVATGGRASWRWVVPEEAPVGPAIVTAACGAGGSATRSLIVVGSLVPPKIVVDQEGFSIRNRTFGGSIVSYGLILRNLSPNADAVNATVMVNFVMANDHLIGTDVRTVPFLPAGTTYAYGGSLRFPGGAPVERLEVVIQVAGRQHKSIHQPALAGLRVVPSLYEPAWLGEVDGEVVNDHPNLTLRSTQLSAVVFDATGRIVGGGTGYAIATLPPGTRQAFKVTSGLDAISAFNGSYARVSALGRYGPPE
jgi:hypothetical protein